MSNKNDTSERVRKALKTYVLPEVRMVYKGPMEILKNLVKSWRQVFSQGMFDGYYFLLVLVLVAFGLSMHYSASYSNVHQFLFAIIGIALMILVSFFSVKSYRLLAPFAMCASTVCLFAVFLFPEYNGTHRWMAGFQPSEIAKITLIMFMAYLIDKYKSKASRPGTFRVFLCITIFYGLLVLLESHLSGCILFLCIGYAMMWYGDMSKKAFFVVTLLAFIVIAAVVIKPTILLKVPKIKDYQVDRIIIWKKILFNGEITAKERINNARQVLQSLYGIGSGGLFGKGFNNSGQKVSNLSEKANDFIFAVVGEELGFMGGLVMLICFGMVVWRGFSIGMRSKSYFGSLLALGISTQMALQVIINIAVATSVLPNTGISLPFFSDGGSSMVFTLASMGMVLGVSKDSVKSTEPSGERVNKNAG